MIGPYDRPSYLNKMQFIKNINNLVFYVIFIFLIEFGGEF